MIAMWHARPMASAHDSALRRKELLTPATTCVNLGDIRRNKPVTEDQDAMIPLTQGPLRSQILETDSRLQLAGVVFLGVGLWAWSEKGVLSDLTKVTRMHGIDPVVLVLMVGVVMFTLGFAGCVGALRENICLLKFFCGAIVLIFFLELAVAVLAFLFQDWVRDRFREFFESNIRSYRDDIDLQNLIDSLQKANQCCGAYGPEDWDLNVYFNCSGASYSREKCGVPFSCCVPDPAQKVVNTQCGYDVRTQLKGKWEESIFTKGCIPALEGWLPRNIYIVAGVFIAISLLQIFGIFLARTLISDIEAVKAGHHF
uniref:Tetraspanin 14 n=1 Tax=Equus caballus TaxID=9796 RepID=A0A9L0S429_HORSE